MNGFIKINDVRSQQIRLHVYYMTDSKTIRFCFLDVDIKTGKEFVENIDFTFDTPAKALMVIKSIDDDFKSGSKFIDVDKTLELLDGDG